MIGKIISLIFMILSYLSILSGIIIIFALHGKQSSSETWLEKIWINSKRLTMEKLIKEK
jgi:hypothetical protein